jgi:nucleoid-associated protein YgaU
MEFWLSYDNHKEKLQLPVNPSEFRLKQGNKNTVVDIQDLGELNLIGNRKLAEIQLSSFFPANWAPYCAYRNIPAPYDAVALIEKWWQSRKPIRLIITDTSVNLACTIEDFEYGERGGTRDVGYILSLKEYRFIEIKKVGQSISTTPTNKVMILSAATRPDTRTPTKTYTVKSGDNLWLISKRVYGDGSKWRDIYNANIGVIGKDPGIIKPGQKLVIP